MGSYIQPLDFRKILIDYFIGSMALFQFAFIILLAFISAKFGFSNRIFLILLAITSMFFIFILGQGILILILIIIGYLAFKGISKIMT